MTAHLAERLRTETRELHTLAERSPFMAALLQGRLSRPAYTALLRNLQAIYAALESALGRHAAHAALALLPIGVLARSASLRDDLAVVGDDGAIAASVQPSALRYVARLHELEAARPELLLAHAYVRYLGDLSGGQMLRGIVAASLKLPADRGVSFYDFGDAAATASLARAFRSGLAAARVADEDAVVAEARLAFEWHCRLFEELATHCGLVAGPAPALP